MFFFWKFYIKLNIKNPNDIFYNGKKLGGILTETKVSGEIVKDLVIGIGIFLVSKFDYEDSIFLTKGGKTLVKGRVRF